MKRKSDGVDFDDWYEEYLEAFEDAGMMRMAAERSMAKRLYDKDWPAAKAGADDADFCMNG